MPPATPETRLCLVAPGTSDDAFLKTLAAALGAGDVASLFVDPALPDAASMASIARANGVAAIGIGSAPRDFDGIHIGTGIRDLRAARAQRGDSAIVGAGGIASRHDAMILGEALPDYVFFGRFDGDDGDAPHAKALELASWWAPLFEIPSILMGGRSLGSIVSAKSAGIEFVALRDAVWNDPRGAAVAVATANAILVGDVSA